MFKRHVLLVVLRLLSVATLVGCSRSENDSIVGTWRQYQYAEDNKPVALGEFIVTKHGGGYVMAPQRQVEAPEVVNTLALTDVTYDGTIWSFKSNWGGGNVSQFRLVRVNATLFEGEVTLKGRFVGKNRWEKIR